MDRKIAILAVLTLLVIVAAGCTKSKTGEAAQQTAQHQDEDLYYCPMHPQVHSPHPGVCPICHMNLVKKQAAGENAPGVIDLSVSQEILANVKTIKLSVQPIEKELSAYSILDFAEDGRKIISAKFNGRVEKLFASVSGVAVKKGSPLFSAYSADIFQTMSEFISAKQRVGDAAEKIADAAKLKLQLAGFTDEQLHDLTAKKEASPYFTFYSPFSGTIVEKKVQEGSYFNEGTALYEIVDMGKLWNIAEFTEADAAFLKTGMKGNFSTQAIPGKNFPVTISVFYPAINKQNSTVKIRTELVRPDNSLKPQMFGETKFSVRLGQGILIPADAILFTGKRELVYVKVGDRKFAAREIKVSAKIGVAYLVVSGISPGEEIALSGGYLLDSESQLKSGGNASTAVAREKFVKNELPAPVPGKASDSKKIEQQQTAPGMQMKAAGRTPIYIDKDDPLYKKLGVFNKVCPVLGEEITNATTLIYYKGKIYGFCCKGCDKKFAAEPENYVKNISKDGKTFLGKKDDQ